MKLSKKQIKLIRKQTPRFMVGTQTSIVTSLGYFMPAGANWSYQAGWTNDGILVVTRFGEVLG